MDYRAHSSTLVPHHFHPALTHRMSGFAALLKLSKSQTEQSELEVQTQIANHQLQLEKKRREQEAKERREREVEAKRRAKCFEEERKEEERKRKRKEEESAKQKELAKREEQMRHALKYGPRKSSAAAGSSKSNGSDRGDGLGLTREELRKRQTESSESSVLTREEKRERKLAAELRRTAGSSSRRSGGSKSVTSLPDGRTVRRLPGGAVDFTTVSRLDDPDASSALPTGDFTGKSARERLAAMPSTLLKLNTVKRDVRTIEEILIDRAKAKQAKVLAGDEAKEFSDWFGKNKKKEKATPQSSFQSQPTSSSPSRGVSATPSGSPAPTVNTISGSAFKPKPATKSPSSFLKPINPKPSTVSRPSGTVPSAPPSKKRPRSPDDEISQPPIKRRASNASRPVAPASRPTAAPSRPSTTASRSSALPNDVVDISSEIWSIFGKDKKSYTARDVLSDDEDMEADAQSVLKEEARRFVTSLLWKVVAVSRTSCYSVPVSLTRRMRLPLPRSDGAKKRRGGGRRSANAEREIRFPRTYVPHIPHWNGCNPTRITATLTSFHHHSSIYSLTSFMLPGQSICISTSSSLCLFCNIRPYYLLLSTHVSLLIITISIHKSCFSALCYFPSCNSSGEAID